MAFTRARSRLVRVHFVNRGCKLLGHRTLLRLSRQLDRRPSPRRLAQITPSRYQNCLLVLYQVDNADRFQVSVDTQTYT